MAIGKIKTTFEIITPESAVRGEPEEEGWEDEDGIEVKCIAETVEFLIDRGVEQGNVRDYHTIDPERNYQTGAETYYGYHLDGFSDENMEKVADIFNKCEKMDYGKCQAMLREMKEECEGE